MPKLCAFGCAPTDVPMHRFPNINKFPERFRAWVILVGGKLETSADYDVYNKKLVCDLHFTARDRNRNKRLNALAVPSQNLPSLQQSSAKLIDRDHVYFRKQKRTTLVQKTEPKESLPLTKQIIRKGLQQISAKLIERDHGYFKKQKRTSFVQKTRPEESLTPTKQIIRKEAKHNSATRYINSINKEPTPVCESKTKSEIPTINADIHISVTKEEDPDCEAEQVDNDDIFENVASEEVVSYCKVATPDSVTNNINSNATNKTTSDCEIIAKSEDTINADIHISVTKEEVIPDCEVGDVDNTINEDICANVSSKEVIFYCKGSNHHCDTFTETDHINDVIDEFLIIPPRTKASLQTTGQRENKGEFKIAPAVTKYNICDNCKKNIVGIRYKCLHCVDYSHCHKCEMIEAHLDHYMMRMPKIKVTEKNIDINCDEVKPIANSVTKRLRQETLFENEPVDNNSKIYDNDGYLSDDGKLIREEVTRVVKNNRILKTYHTKANMCKMKRKMKMPDDTFKKRKMDVQTTEVKDKVPAFVKMDTNYDIPDSLSEKATETCKDLTAIARIVQDATCPGSVYMALSSDVCRLVIEIIKDGKKTLYQYAES